METIQPEFPIEVKEKPDCSWLVEMLRGRDWMTAAEILVASGRPNTESQRRWIREVADWSDGQIGGGQKGYKLVKEMTIEEFDHVRNSMLSQAREMQRRVVEMDRQFYPRQPVPKIV